MATRKTMNKNKIISSLLFKSVERLGVKGFGLIISIILARMLSPQEFGQIAIIMVFISLSLIMTQSGLNTALVQKKNPTAIDYSTVFYITLAVSTVLFGIIFLIAPAVSRYYDDPALTAPLRVYSTTLIFNSYNSVQIAKLQKEMRFKPLMVCTLIATILSGALGVVMAYCGAGLWALVGYYMSNGIFVTLAILFVERWYPGWEISMDSAKQLFSYGWKILVASALCNVSDSLRSLIIGKRYSTSDLGYYNRGQQLPQVITYAMDSSVQSVMLPAMSEVQNEQDRLKKLLKKTLSLSAFLIVPTMFGLAAVSSSVVKVLYSEKWLPCVVYMQLLCIADASYPIITSNLTMIKATGRSDIFMKLEIARRIMIVSILCVSVFCFRNAVAIAAGYCISAWLDCLMVWVTVRWKLKVPMRDQIAAVLKPLLASTVMLLILLPTNQLHLPSILLLTLQVVVGAGLYLGLSILLKNDSVVMLKNMLRKKKSK